MNSLLYHVAHQTTYRYSGLVVLSRQLLHMMPRATEWQERITHDLSFSTTPSQLETGYDAFGNPMCWAEIDTPYKQLTVSAQMQVRILPRGRQVARETLPWEAVRDSLAYHGKPLAPGQLDIVRYRTESPYVRIKHELGQYAADCFIADAPILVGAEALMRKIHREFAYEPGSTAIATPMLTAFRQRHGVCQDFAHIMIGCLRSLGLAAHYVSGYLRTEPPPGQPHLVGADASHAWVAVYCPPLGWVELDPTNNMHVDSHHITLAWGRDFGDVSPLRGILTGASVEELRVEVTVTPLSKAICG
ncbi:MAG: transglutaminase protein [Proteobacteria bacterium]|nr:transglutaminase protein [Pseudomonadota bacterium]